MIATEPQVAPSGRYSATETYKVLGVSRDTLRRHSRQGKIKFGIRKINNKKFYKGIDILAYWRAQI